MVTLHMKVHGRVQGVGFRFYTQQQASRLGVQGWVRNEADGTVEVLAQGDKATMQKFVAAVKKGSPASQVEHVETKEIRRARGHKSFQIKY